MGTIPSALAGKEGKTAASMCEDSPDIDEHKGAILGGDAPSETEISLLEDMISASEMVLMMKKMCRCGIAVGG